MSCHFSNVLGFFFAGFFHAIFHQRRQRMAGGKDACELARGLPRNGRLRAAGDGGQQSA